MEDGGWSEGTVKDWGQRWKNVEDGGTALNGCGIQSRTEVIGEGIVGRMDVGCG
jgi:hypothetical protein